MRITFILPTVAIGGGTKVVGLHARELANRGHEVRLISPPPQRLPFNKKLKSWLNGTGWPAHQSSLPSHLDGLNLDHRILDVWRPVVDRDVPDGDVVIATWWETAEWVNRLSAKKGAKVYFIQGHEVFNHLPVERARATYSLRFHKIVVSKWLRDIMETEYGDKHVDLVPNSVDKSQFFAGPRLKQSVPTVGFLYSAVGVKGVDVTLAALERVRECVPMLAIKSFGSVRPISNLPLLDRTEFFLSPSQDRLRDIYSSCDVWISASRSEGFNLPAMEAMACRTPVVSTRVGWPSESVRTGWNGVLVEVDDLVALAEGIKWVVSQNDEDWRCLSENSLATVSSTSWASSTSILEQSLEHACLRVARGEI